MEMEKSVGKKDKHKKDAVISFTLLFHSLSRLLFIWSLQLSLCVSVYVCVLIGGAIKATARNVRAVRKSKGGEGKTSR